MPVNTDLLRRCMLPFDTLPGVVLGCSLLIFSCSSDAATAKAQPEPVILTDKGSSKKLPPKDRPQCDWRVIVDEDCWPWEEDEEEDEDEGEEGEEEDEEDEDEGEEDEDEGEGEEDEGEEDEGEEDEGEEDEGEEDEGEEGEGEEDEGEEDEGEEDEGEGEEDEGEEDEGNTSNSAIGVCENSNPIADQTLYPVSIAQANQASRFLNHATLGVNYATITQVANMGETQWLEDQFNQPIGKHLPYSKCLLDVYMGLSFAKADAIFGDPVEFRRFAWWTQVMTAPDLLRQRIAMALSEIFVVSDNVGKLRDELEPLPGYYDMLLSNSFTNFRDLLFNVTMHPSMGVYLSHLNNAKANTQKGTFPDENYAREVMQLFSIGLFELNPDGSRKKDSQGKDIPTYNNETIREFAKVFTGLSYAGDEFGDQAEEDYFNYAEPMKMFDRHHDTTAKTLLNGVTLPSGQKGMKDINGAVDNLFNHPNVGPFIGQLLIKRLVTSNPSPAYISRVSAAFNGNGDTPRGDMKNVIRAILLDPEAQSASAVKLREPFLRIVQLYRAFNATSSDRTYNNEGEEIKAHINQFALNSPSVFNFFQPDYAPNGEIKDAGLVAPEFQIVDSATVIGVKNYLHEALLNELTMLTPQNFAPVQFDLSLETDIAEDPELLLDYLDVVLTYGTLTANSRQAIMTAIKGVDDAKQRVLLGIYLMMVSPDYAAAL